MCPAPQSYMDPSAVYYGKLQYFSCYPWRDSYVTYPESIYNPFGDICDSIYYLLRDSDVTHVWLKIFDKNFDVL